MNVNISIVDAIPFVSMPFVKGLGFFCMQMTLFVCNLENAFFLYAILINATICRLNSFCMQMVLFVCKKRGWNHCHGRGLPPLHTKKNPGIALKGFFVCKNNLHTKRMICIRKKTAHGTNPVHAKTNLAHIHIYIYIYIYTNIYIYIYIYQKVKPRGIFDSCIQQSPYRL